VVRVTLISGGFRTLGQDTDFELGARSDQGDKVGSGDRAPAGLVVAEAANDLVDRHKPVCKDTKVFVREVRELILDPSRIRRHP
jgi:hypothetical protein